MKLKFFLFNVSTRSMLFYPSESGDKMMLVVTILFESSLRASNRFPGTALSRVT